MHDASHTRTPALSRRLLPLALACLLSACGGGGSSSPSPAPQQPPLGSDMPAPGQQMPAPTPAPAPGLPVPNPGGGAQPQPGNPSAPSAQTPAPIARYDYRILPARFDNAAFLQMLQTQGVEGYRFLSRKALEDANDTLLYELLVKDIDTSYEYHMVPAPEDIDETLAMLNQQGQQGYRYYTHLIPDPAQPPQMLFVRDVRHTGRYHYRIEESVDDAEGLLAQANPLGQEGYWFVEPVLLRRDDALVRQHLYVRDESLSPRPRYQYLVSPEGNWQDPQALKEQFDQFGAKGYRLKYPVRLPGQHDHLGERLSGLYVKDASRQLRFSYRITQSQQQANNFLTQAKKHGNERFGQLFTHFDQEIYFQGDCGDYLCSVLQPLSQN